MSRPQRIGILSGTFDPIHEGHVRFALQAIRQEKLDRVYFMVERHPRRKQGVRAFEHRQAMVQLALEDEPKLGSIITHQQRFSANETLPLLKRCFGSVELVLIAGDDMLSHMNEWPHVDELISQVRFVFGVRGDKQLAEKRIKTIQTTRSIDFRYSFIDDVYTNVSSSRIRSHFRHKERPSYIHPKVAAYIQIEGLYVSADSAQS